MSRLSLFLLSLALLAAPLRAAPPNVIFILADDMGYSDLGCYGGEIATPNLDGLATGGLRFTQFYNCARCWPSRAALLTGYYPQEIHRDLIPGLGGGGGNKNVRPVWARLLPDFLRPSGYRCYHSGKWHLDGKVLAGGFDRSLNLENQGNYFTAKGNLIDDVKIEVPANEGDYYATNAVVDHALDCLKDHAAHYAGKPFFHYIAFISPHFPLHALPEDIARYRDHYLEGWDLLRKERHARQQQLGLLHTPLSAIEREVGPPYAFPDALEKLGPAEVNRPLPWESLTEEQRRFQAAKMAIHAAMVDRMDREIGRLLGFLRSSGQLDNTLIFFASDNGASAEIMVRHGGHDRSAAPGSAATYLCLGPGFSSLANTPFRRHKTWVHEGGIATPLIVHWPAGIAARGELRRTPSHLIDVVPTVLEATGIGKPTQWEGQPVPPAPGRSLVAAFKADVTVPRDHLWWFHEGNRALRVGDWKIVSAEARKIPRKPGQDGYSYAPWELYNLAKDRAESTNQAAAHPEIVADLEKKWKEQLALMTGRAR